MAPASAIAVLDRTTLGQKAVLYREPIDSACLKDKHQNWRGDAHIPVPLLHEVKDTLSTSTDLPKAMTQPPMIEWPCLRTANKGRLQKRLTCVRRSKWRA